MRSEEKRVQALLALAGIEVDGGRPWDIQVLHPAFYPHFVGGGSLALGESYVDGLWDCPRVDQMISRMLEARLDESSPRPAVAVWMGLRRAWFNLQKAARAFQVGERHYDLGNQLFQQMLDRRMVYSCAYWKDAKTLDEAQEAKLDMICKKLALRQGETLLDIGCGWGALLKFAAENYGVRGVGVTIAREQAELARRLCRGLPVDIRLIDYRQLHGSFDKVASVGMFEHVGTKNYREYFEVAHRCLKDGGTFLLHTIASADLNNSPDPWMERYIFPNSIVPNARQIVEAVDRLFHMEAWHGIGADYDPTLMAWFRNFHRRWPVLRRGYDERFYRKWKYYLLASAGAFRSRRNQVWQILLTKVGANAGVSMDAVRSPLAGTGG
jgi:cyclopropane-fatty-acyl-phospholipid synthase